LRASVLEKCDQEYLKVVRESGQVVFGRRYGGTESFQEWERSEDG
jgi:hypothetical protein